MKIEILQKDDILPIMEELQQLKKLLQEIKEEKRRREEMKGLNHEPEILSITRAAKIAGVSINTLRKAIAAGLITAAPITPGGQPRIVKAELERFLAEHGKMPKPSGKVPPFVEQYYKNNY